MRHKPANRLVCQTKHMHRQCFFLLLSIVFVQAALFAGSDLFFVQGHQDLNISSSLLLQNDFDTDGYQVFFHSLQPDGTNCASGDPTITNGNISLPFNPLLCDKATTFKYRAVSLAGFAIGTFTVRYDTCQLTVTSEHDILFLMDGSGSVAPSSFSFEKTFFNSLVSRFNIGAQVRVGVAQFSLLISATSPRGFGFNSTSVGTIQSSISAISQYAAQSFIAGALDFALTMIQANARINVPRTVVLVTDGTANIPCSCSDCAARYNTSAACLQPLYFPGKTCSNCVNSAPNFCTPCAEYRPRAIAINNITNPRHKVVTILCGDASTVDSFSMARGSSYRPSAFFNPLTFAALSSVNLNRVVAEILELDDNCTCGPNWSGTNCSLTSCFGISNMNSSVCSSSGVCTNFNECTCNQGRTGLNCSQIACFSKLPTDPTVCSGRGTCFGPNFCICNPAYFGPNCAFHSCFNVSSASPSVCNGRGDCLSMNNCSCDANYSGGSCNVTSCFGISSSNASVCFQNAYCSAFNNCTCLPCYTGPNCTFNYCKQYGTTSNATVMLGVAGQVQVLPISLMTSLPSGTIPKIICMDNVTRASIPTMHSSGSTFLCTFSSIVHRRYRLVLAYDNTSFVISNTSIVYDIVANSSLSFLSTSRVAALVFQSLQVSVALGLVPLDASRILCFQSNVGYTAPVQYIPTATFSCAIAASSVPVQVTLSLVYNYTTLLPICSNTLTISFVSSSDAFMLSTNLQYVATSLDATVSLPSSVIFSSLYSMLACRLTTTQQYPVSFISSSIGPNVSCSIFTSTAGTHGLSIVMSNGVGNPLLVLSNNLLPLVIIQNVSVASAFPTSVPRNTLFALNITLVNAFALPYQNASYFCLDVANGLSYAATIVSRTVLCNHILLPNAGTYTFLLYVQANAQSSLLPMSSPVSISSWEFLNNLTTPNFAFQMNASTSVRVINFVVAVSTESTIPFNTTALFCVGVVQNVLYYFAPMVSGASNAVCNVNFSLNTNETYVMAVALVLSDRSNFMFYISNNVSVLLLPGMYMIFC